jgi:hypothetical protein
MGDITLEIKQNLIQHTTQIFSSVLLCQQQLGNLSSEVSKCPTTKYMANEVVFFFLLQISCKSIDPDSLIKLEAEL